MPPIKKIKTRPVANYQRNPETDPHLPHTTHYQDRPEMETTLPPEAKAMIDERFPEMVRVFQQYDQSTGMLEMYRIVRDVTQAIGWPDSSAYLIRDYILGKINKAKIKPFPGDNVFQIESTNNTLVACEIVDLLLHG